MKILLIEDDLDFSKVLLKALMEEGFAVECAPSGDEGLYLAREWDFDLVILDRLLPGLDGIEVLKRLRGERRIPVLMLTALNSTEDRVEGLEAGADDYLGKPFDLRELVARIRALIRRAYELPENGLKVGDLSFDLQTHSARRGDEPIELSASEWKILELLLLRRGRIVSRQSLEDHLCESQGDLSPNALEVHIHRLRQKVGKSLIQTRRGQGYVFVIPQQETRV